LVVSVDSLDSEIYSRIRKKGNLSIVLENLKKLKFYDESRIKRGLGTMNLRLSVLFQKDNWHELGNFHDFALENNLKIFRTFLLEPKEYSMLSLAEEKRVEILDFYLHNLRQDQLKYVRRILLPLLDSLTPILRAQYLLMLNEKSNQSALV
jgi:MoaA/NifB/PqqE/SkfB family radical SAM enzyme